MTRILAPLALVVALAANAHAQSAQSDTSTMNGATANSQTEPHANSLPQTTTTPPAPETSSANVNNSANVSGHEYAAEPTPQNSQQATAQQNTLPPPADKDATTQPQASGATPSR